MTQHKEENRSPLHVFCEEKRRLTEEFLAANRILMDLQTQQVEAIIHNDLDFQRFDDLIHVAREKKDNAKYALIAHVETHYC